MKDTKRLLTAAVIAALLFLFLFLGMHWNLLVAVLLSVGVYIGFLILLKPDPENGKMYVESMPGGEELEKLLKDARKDLAAMEESIGAIRDSHVQRDACMLHGTGKRILAYLESGQDQSGTPFFYLLSGYGRQPFRAVCGFSGYRTAFRGSGGNPSENRGGTAGFE